MPEMLGNVFPHRLLPLPALLPLTDFTLPSLQGRRRCLFSAYGRSFIAQYTPLAGEIPYSVEVLEQCRTLTLSFPAGKRPFRNVFLTLNADRWTLRFRYEGIRRNIVTVSQYCGTGAPTSRPHRPKCCGIPG